MAVISCWQSLEKRCWCRGKVVLAYLNAPSRPLFWSSGSPFIEGPWNSHRYCSLQSSNSRFEPRFSNSTLFCLAHSIAGCRFLSFSWWRIRYMSENLACSSCDCKEERSFESSMAGLGVPGVGEGCGGLCRASSRNVVATENCPSRSRCMAIALLIKEGCAARASYSAANALTGKCYTLLVTIS